MSNMLAEAPCRTQKERSQEMTEERKRICGNCYWWHHDYGCVGTCIMSYVSSSVNTYPGCHWHEFEEEHKGQKSEWIVVPDDEERP